MSQTIPFQKTLRSGFTLVELLVVIGLISAIIAIVLQVGGSLKATADRAREMAAGRALSQAWNGYAMDHLGEVLPGYTAGLDAFDPLGNRVDVESSPVAAKRWPWRLTPYLGDDISSLYSDGQKFRQQGLSIEDNSSMLYQVSVFPSFGMNSIFVGGDENYGGSSDIFTEIFGQFYVKRLSTVRRPDRLVVFATARSRAEMNNGNSSIYEGFFRILPPAWSTQIWASEHVEDDPLSSGMLSNRHQSKVITASVDGRVDVDSISDLRDMQRWSDAATSKDWVLTPK
jgi:prepilin-type N-terminal cleavage/methylation domain-containing protein